MGVMYANVNGVWTEIMGQAGPTGPPGPTAVSADAGNTAVLGTDSLLYVPGGNEVSIGVSAPTDASELWVDQDAVAPPPAVGPTGPRGATGAAGVDGATGPTGATGPQAWLTPRVRVGLAVAGWSLPNGAWTTIPWEIGDPYSYDTHAMWSAANPSRFTCPAGQDGLYMIHLELPIGAGGAAPAVKGVNVMKNDVASWLSDGEIAFGGIGQVMKCHGPFPFVAGEWITARAYQDIGAPILIPSAGDTFFAMERIA